MEKKKIKWGKPKLIVLVRGEPDERVLAACKMEGLSKGPGNAWGWCFGTYPCPGCNAMDTS